MKEGKLTWCLSDPTYPPFLNVCFSSLRLLFRFLHSHNTPSCSSEGALHTSALSLGCASCNAGLLCHHRMLQLDWEQLSWPADKKLVIITFIFGSKASARSLSFLSFLASRFMCSSWHSNKSRPSISCY